MAATILLIRHAEHVHYNQRLSGRMEGVPLSHRGRHQAASLGERLAGSGIARVETSPLERTRETAEAIAAAAALPPPERVDALIELDMGDWTGRALGTFGDDPVWRRWNEHRATARIPGGESMAEAQTRIAAHLTDTARRHDEQVVALVTHADLIRAAVAHVLGLSLDNLLRFEVDPASVTRLVVGNWGAKLLGLNEKED